MEMPRQLGWTIIAAGGSALWLEGGSGGHGPFVDGVALQFGERAKMPNTILPVAVVVSTWPVSTLSPTPRIFRSVKADDMGQRAVDAIELPHNERVAILGNVEHLGKAGTLGRTSRTDIFINPLASNRGLLQSDGLSNSSVGFLFRCYSTPSSAWTRWTTDSYA
jgi:hypothetical protein